jgi:hypothetical protein
MGCAGSDRRGRIVRSDVPGATETAATGISDRDQIVGFFSEIVFEGRPVRPTPLRYVIA